MSIARLDSSQYLSTADVAERLGNSQSTVRRRIESGEIQAESYQGSWRIPAASLAADHNVPSGHDILAERLAELPILLDPEQAGELLGLSAWAVRDACRRGDLPFVRIGRRVRVPTPAIVSMLTGGSKGGDALPEPTPDVRPSLVATAISVAQIESHPASSRADLIAQAFEDLGDEARVIEILAWVRGAMSAEGSRQGAAG